MFDFIEGQYVFIPGWLKDYPHGIQNPTELVGKKLKIEEIDFGLDRLIKFKSHYPGFQYWCFRGIWITDDRTSWDDWKRHPGCSKIYCPTIDWNR